jgi:hypothetical protein
MFHEQALAQLFILGSLVLLLKEIRDCSQRFLTLLHTCQAGVGTPAATMRRFTIGKDISTFLLIPDIFQILLVDFRVQVRHLI